MEGKKQDHRSHPRARTYGEMSEADELSLVVSSQRRELMAATATESDLELAFHLQMEEAMAASLALPSSSSSSSGAAASSISPPPTAAIATTEPEKDDEGITHLIKLQSLELDRYNLEMNDLEMSRAMTRQAVDDISRRALDERFALEILEMPEDEWEEYGDLFDRPIDAARTAEEPNFRLYFKGMATEEFVKGSSVKVAAIAIAVCDLCGNLILKVQKPVPYSAVGTCRLVLEATALVEGLNAVISLGIKRLDVFCDYRTLCNYVRGIWNNKRNKIADVINQVLLLQRKFERCGIFLVPRCHVKFVFKLAREAIDSQLPKNIVDLRITGETCNICLEITDSSEMFAVNSCSHRFCCSCLQQHVEVKLLNGVLPGCPHDGCKVVLALEDARKFLPPKLLEIMISRLKEASIPANEKVYCPYPRCSALMSIHEAKFPQQESSSKKFIFNASGLRKCIKCNGSFCINCKVPWHENLSCSEFKRSNPHPHSEEVKLRSLAKAKLWRQCIKCNHMIELLEGCFHMTCRCGYEFCYTCGLEYKNKSPACKCPLFAYSSADEDSDFDEEDDDFDDEDEPYYSDYDDYSAYRPF